MKGNTKFLKLIETSVHGIKLFQYTSVVLEELKWIVKEKECFNVDTGKVDFLDSYT